MPIYGYQFGKATHIVAQENIGVLHRQQVRLRVLFRREYVSRKAIGRPFCRDLCAVRSPGIEVMYHGFATGLGNLLQATLKNQEELVWCD